jgi:type IV pilus assembly protein PilA
MMDKIRKGLRSDEGFTLVELMVVVLIIAILMAIAIPTFLGAREKAQDRAIQANLRNALTAEKVYYVDAEEYSATVTDIQPNEPSLTFQAGYAATTSTPGDVFLAIDATAGIVCLSGVSGSGTLFVVKDNTTGTNPGTWYKNAGTTAETSCSNATGGTAPNNWKTNGW